MNAAAAVALAALLGLMFASGVWLMRRNDARPPPEEKPQPKKAAPKFSFGQRLLAGLVAFAESVAVMLLLMLGLEAAGSQLPAQLWSYTMAAYILACGHRPSLVLGRYARLWARIRGMLA